jgi:hypothetical protein
MDTADADVVNVDYISRFSFQMAPVSLRHVAALNGLAPRPQRTDFLTWNSAAAILLELDEAGRDGRSRMPQLLAAGIVEPT